MKKRRKTIDKILGIEPVKKKKKAGKKREEPKPYNEQYPVFFQLLKQTPEIGEPVEEYRFHNIRKWRIDLAWPDHWLAVEIEGGIYRKDGGGHRSISGYLRDMEKYNSISVHGFYLLRFTVEEMVKCDSYDVICEWFKSNTKVFGEPGMIKQG